MRVLDTQPVRDLLRAPGRGPAPVWAATVPRPDPAPPGSGHALTVGSGYRTGEAVLHVLAQLLVRGELGDLRAAGSPLCVPLRRRRPVLQAVRASRGGARELLRGGCRGPAHP